LVDGSRVGIPLLKLVVKDIIGTIQENKNVVGMCCSQLPQRHACLGIKPFPLQMALLGINLMLFRKMEEEKMKWIDADDILL
jgi:hypothetical protein